LYRKAFSWFKIVSKTIFIISLFLFQRYKKTTQVTAQNNRRPMQKKTIARQVGS